MKLGIIGAMQVEVETLLQLLTEVSVTKQAGLSFYEGCLGATQVIVVRSGIGKVNAALCTQSMIDLFHPDYVLNTGVAGGLDAAMQVGDAVVATSLMYHDFDAGTPHAIGEIPQMGRSSIFEVDTSLTEALFLAAQRVYAESERQVYQGRIASGDQFVVSHEVKERIVADTDGACCCEMEGAAIAHVAALNNIPCAVLRTISDVPGRSKIEDFDFFAEREAHHAARIVELLCQEELHAA